MKMNSLTLNSTWASSAQAADRSSWLAASSTKPERGLRFVLLGRPAERRRDTSSAPARRATGSASLSDLRAPTIGLLEHKRVVHHRQRLRRHVRHAAAADRRERRGIVEGQKHRREKITPHGQIDAAPAVAIERPDSSGRPRPVMNGVRCGITPGPYIVSSSRPETASMASRIASASSRRTAIRCQQFILRDRP